MEGRKKVKEQQGVKKGVNVSKLGVSRKGRKWLQTTKRECFID